MLSEQELGEIEERNSQVKGGSCPECEGFGHIEVYPPHSAEAYTGTGEPTWDTIPCPICEDIPVLLAEVRRLRQELERYRWRRVDEGLPKEIGYCLVAYEEPGSVTTIYYRPLVLSTGFPREITHWMPLPPMPEGADDGSNP